MIRMMLKYVENIVFEMPQLIQRIFVRIEFLN